MIANLLPEHLWYWQKILGKVGRGSLERYMMGAGIGKLFSGFPSFTPSAGLGLSGVALQEPRTEYHPSLSGCSGRSPSPTGKLSGLPSSSCLAS